MNSRSFVVSERLLNLANRLKVVGCNRMILAVNLHLYREATAQERHCSRVIALSQATFREPIQASCHILVVSTQGRFDYGERALKLPLRLGVILLVEVNQPMPYRLSATAR